MYLLQNHFLGKSLDEKNSGRKLFFVENFCCKITSSEIDWMKKILAENFFWSKFCFVQIHFLENWMKKMLVEKFFVENFIVANPFPRKQLG